ncbi:hypothetical protein MNAN1_002653 [Malassezia nana]|uniref:C2H2-type domain-containing protein n=1 Tax=Malassezia nana TaxID=180528 RepID=A0AAF0J341_9BASI|nr:hypothetical protein MNAN1_002653 [Malassezia nana]
MAKKKKAPQLDAWCWYCDRDFEDEKVLIQHQKAKHFKCPFCPRRLNTAGGLAVHLGQVHKAQPGRLENTLPGRDSFEIEIYGMVGVPDSDLIAWQVRRSGERAASGPSKSVGPPVPKRPRIEKMALSADELRAQLAAHKALMSGAASTSAPPVLTQAQAPSSNVQPAQAPSQPSMETPPPAPPPTAPTEPSSNIAAVPATTAPPHTKALQQGLKSRLAYADTVLSPEEKMATMPRYAYTEPTTGAPL